MMNWIHRGFALGQLVISLLFVLCAVTLMTLAAFELWRGLDFTSAVTVSARLNAVLESITLLTVAVAALELGQTVIEEEVQRQAHLSAPTRARRFLSRFMIVLVVALSIETLAAVFLFVHEAPEYLPQAALVGLAAAALLAAWGVFVYLNRSVEELEPEALARAQAEDAKLERQ